MTLNQFQNKEFKERQYQRMLDVVVKHPNAKLISREYNGAMIKHRIFCGISGHIPFWIRPNDLFCENGNWCPKCKGDKLSKDKRIWTESYIQNQLIKQRKTFTLLPDQNSKNNWNLLRWQCLICLHPWETSPNKIFNKGTGCPKCGGTLKITKQKTGEIFKKEGFTLITWGGNVMKKNDLICSEGHLCQISLHSFKQGRRCSQCFKEGNLRGETRTREIFEEIFSPHLFPTKRPPWLINFATNRRLELDGYNNNLQIAFEYQGIQHYEEVKVYNKIYSLQEIQKHDQIKVQRCQEMGIKLFVIDGRNCYQSKDEIREQINFIQNITSCNLHSFPEPERIHFVY